VEYAKRISVSLRLYDDLVVKIELPEVLVVGEAISRMKVGRGGCRETGTEFVHEEFDLH
jgi:hypothetical protein